MGLHVELCCYGLVIKVATGIARSVGIVQFEKCCLAEDKLVAQGQGEIADSYIDLIQLGDALGYITIPKIDLNLPIYEGTGADVLTHGVGHLPQTSYPLGGESTHSALSGHRGMAEAELFTNLDKLEIGDKFLLPHHL